MLRAKWILYVNIYRKYIRIKNARIKYSGIKYARIECTRILNVLELKILR